MLNNKLKCAVIGVENMGLNHARVFFEMADAELVAVSDINQNTADEAAKRFSTIGYSDYTKMINEKKPDIVSVCVPTFLHRQVAEYCLEQKINVLLEKPIAMNLKDAEFLLEKAKQSGVKFLVGHIERHNPAIKKVKEIIDRGELGNVINIIARRVGGFPPQIKDANIAVDLAIHDIDIVNYLLGEVPMEVSVDKKRNHIEKREDSVAFFLKYKNASAFIQSNWITPVKIRKLNITGSEGYLEMDYIEQTVEFYKSNYEKFKESFSDYSDYILKFSKADKITIDLGKKEPLKEELSYFVNCVANDVVIDSSFAMEALKIALK